MEIDDLKFTSSFPATEDFPREELPEGVPCWSESFGHWAYFPDQKLSLFIHNQRHVSDFLLWREIIVLQRGDGKVIAAKSYGKGRTDGAPRANGLSIENIRPFREWRLDFDGAAQIVSNEALWESELKDGVHEVVRLSLHMEAFMPVWGMAKNESATDSWGSAHYEQGVRLKGTLVTRDDVMELDGLGWRDHSYGPRDFVRMPSAQWMHGQFGSGRSFLASRTQPRGTIPRFEFGFVHENGQIHNARVITVPDIEEPIPGKTTLIELEYDNKTARIECTYLGGVPLTLAGVNEQIIGCNSTRDTSSDFYYDHHLKYRWDGETGYGCANTVLMQSGANIG